jgi:predicted ATPase/class 3 adenylate cyclase
MTMSEQERIERAIAAVDTQRAILGDGVANTTIASLQERLARLEDGSTALLAQQTTQRKQITILFANLTGLPGIADSQYDTALLDIMKLLWQRLDRAITEQGGIIDKHTGDGVMGLFGAPVVGEDDPERAVRAALAMRAVLTEFVNEMKSFQDANVDAGGVQPGAFDSRLFGNLQLRAGINTGPVLLGKVGTGDEYTVIGAAVNVASRLERTAPAGSILISHDTYLLVRGVFNVEPLGPVAMKGKSEPVPAYMVLGLNPRTLFPSVRGVEGIKTQMVGRDAEMRQLQRALVATAKSGSGSMITITGEAGVGKSRLVREFTHWISGLSDRIMIFRGRTDERMRDVPYALVRDLVTTHFGIQDSDQTAVVEEKLTNGMLEFMTRDDDDLRVRAHAIGQLVGLSVSDQRRVATPSTESPQARDRALSYLADFFGAVATRFPAILMILEDMHWADDRSLALVDQLAGICNRVPLLLICVTRQQPGENRRPWVNRPAGSSESTSSPAARMIELAALSEAESRQLVVEILHKIPQIPDELCDLIVTRAEGNPFYVEELIKVLIEDGVIVTGEKQWRIQQNQYRKVRVPPTLTGVLQARLDRLSSLERATLQRAAVVGRVFWDSTVIFISELAEKPQHASQTRIALQALEKRELIFRQLVSGFAGTEAYIFKHAVLRDVTYESVLLRLRPGYHKLTADWLAEKSGERIGEYASLIGEHYEKAGEHILAAQMYETAAARAQEMYNPDIATDYYCRALSLLSEESQHTDWQLNLQEQLGELLQLQARLVEAIQNYMTMQYIAEADGNLDAQARAWNGLAAIRREQGDYENMLESAGRAQQIAWLAGAEEELTLALLYEGEAHFHLGEIEAALAAGEKALERSRRLNLTNLALSLSFLCSVHTDSGNEFAANHYLTSLEEEMAAAEAGTASPEELAFCRVQLGRVYDKKGRYDRANSCLLRALETYRQTDNQLAIASTLNALGDTGRLRGNPTASVSLYREALSIASAIGNQYGEMSYRSNLGGALVGLGEYSAATNELNKVTRLSKDVARVVHWIGLPKTSLFLAEAYLGQEDVAEALTAALQAHAQAQPIGDPLLMGAAWRVLGMVAARLPPEELPLIVNGAPYSPPGLYAESMRVLRENSTESAHAYREQAQTLIAWSAYERARGNYQPSIEMRAQAEILERKLEAVLAE